MIPAPLIVDQPQEGYYRTRLAKGGPWVPVHIWHGPPHDPLTGELLDRSPRWQALRNGEECNAAEIWNWCCGNPITEAEYRHMVAVKDWAVQHAPHEPEANPYRAMNIRAAAPVGPPNRNQQGAQTMTTVSAPGPIAPAKPQHKDFQAIIAEVIDGKRMVPNYEEMSLEEGVAHIAAGSGLGAIPGVKNAKVPGSDSNWGHWARYFLGATQGGQFDGTGYVMFWVQSKGRIGKFAICKHQKVEGHGANHGRGWHPGRCSECGLDMSVDSGD